MALEIERKFRVTSESWRPLVTRTRKIRQAYLSKGPQLSLRVRIDGAESAILTIKAAVTDVVRHEFEYFVPVFDAEALFRWRDGAVITKTRHIVSIDSLVWEIDVFEGENGSLVIAEVELDSAEQSIRLPSWLGKEVTGDQKFYDACQSAYPYMQW